MSIYQKASLVQIPSGYKAADDKLYSVIPANGDGDFTVDVDADATRVNSDGLIESTVANQARLNYNFIDGVVQPDPHLLLEPTRTNKLSYSEDYSQSSWSKVNTTATDNQIIAPDGSLTGGRVQRTSTNGSYFQQAISESLSGNYYSISIWVKKGNSDRVALRLQTNYPDRYDVRFVFSTESVELDQVYGDLTNGSYNVVKYPNDWYRIEITVKTASDNTQVRLALSPRVSTGDTDSTDTSSDAFCYIWGAQLETSGNTSGGYSTSYIPTSGSAVTRTEDNVYNGGTDSVFNLTEGTLFFDVEVFRPIDDAQRLISLSDGGSFNRILAIPKDTENQMRYFCEIGGSQDDVTLAFSYNTRQKIAIAYGGGNIKIYRNGSQQSSRTSGTTFTDLDRINFSDYDNNPKSTAKIYQTMYFNEKLSDSELATITTL